MAEYGATHKLIVEHDEQGTEETGDPGQDTYLSEVRYTLKHPPQRGACSCAMTEASLRACLAHGEKAPADGEGGCWGDDDAIDTRPECPITDQIDAVGILDVLGVRRFEGGRFITDHLREGVYLVTAWGQVYHGPEGDDYDGGLHVEAVEVQS